MFSIFSRQNDGDRAKTEKNTASGKKRAVAFVDYEHWYISMDKFYHIKPDIRAWRAHLAEKYDIRDIIFFGDFSNPSLRAEIPRIREITSYIIETQNASDRHKKDYTDFIMLDHIYQKAMVAPDIDVYVIFSGDGHFSSVASFLVNRCSKTVAVYGIRDALSNQLRNTATEAFEWPIDLDAELAAAAASGERTPRGERRRNDGRFERGRERIDRSFRRAAESEDMSDSEQQAREAVRAARAAKFEAAVSAAGRKSAPEAEQSIAAPENEKAHNGGRRGRVGKADTAAKSPASQTAAVSEQPKEQSKPERAGRHAKKADAAEGKPAEKSAEDKTAANKSVGTGEERSSRRGDRGRRNAAQKPEQTPAESPAPVAAVSAPADKQNARAGNNRRGRGNGGGTAPVSKNPALSEDNPLMPYCRQLIKHLETAVGSKAPTYSSTLDAVSSSAGADRDMLDISLRKLIELGYITEQRRGFKSKSLTVDWQKLRTDGIC